MDRLDLMTFFGQTKFDTSAEAHGLQSGPRHGLHPVAGSVGNLAKQVVWPAAAKTADAVYPMP